MQYVTADTPAASVPLAPLVASPADVPVLPVTHVPTPAEGSRPPPAKPEGKASRWRRRDPGRKVSVEAKLMMVIVGLLLSVDAFLFVYVTHSHSTTPPSNPQVTTSAPSGSTPPASHTSTSSTRHN